MKQKWLLLPAARVLVFALYAFFYLATGFVASSVPYAWGDNSVLWHLAVKPFMALMLVTLLVAAYMLFKKKRSNAHKTIAVATGFIFLLNAIGGSICFTTLIYSRCNEYHWIAYPIAPILYGFLFYLVELFFDRIRNGAD